MPSRKKSTDPLQEILRSRKDNFNANTSDLIAKLIAFKRGLNGRGDKNFGLPVSNIKEPLPTQVSSFLEQITSDFQSIVGQAREIISEQNSYSQKRKKSLHRQALLQFNYKLASNPLTRFWARLNPNLSDSNDRLSLLKLAAELDQEIKKFRHLVLSTNVADIPNVIDAKKQVGYLMATFFHTLFALKEKYDTSNKEEATEEEKQHYALSNEEESKIINRIQKEISDRKPLPSTINNFLDWIGRRINLWSISQSENEKDEYFQEIMEKYNLILNFLSEKVSKETNKNIKFKTISEFIFFSKEKKDLPNIDDVDIEEIIGIKKANISNFLYEKKHKLFSDTLSANKLIISSILKKAIKTLNEIMNSLETRMDYEFIRNQFNLLSSLLDKDISHPIKAIIKYYEQYAFQEDQKEKDKERAQDYLTRQRTRRYLSSDI